MPSSSQILNIFRLNKRDIVGQRFHILDVNINEEVISKYNKYKHKITITIDAQYLHDIIDIVNDIFYRKGPYASIAIRNCYSSEIDISTIRYLNISQGLYKNYPSLSFETLSTRVPNSKCR